MLVKYEYASEDNGKSRLAMVLGKELYVAQLEQGGWTRWHPEVLSNINQSVIKGHKYSVTVTETELQCIA